jgi:hypothetical protein
MALLRLPLKVWLALCAVAFVVGVVQLDFILMGSAILVAAFMTAQSRVIAWFSRRDSAATAQRNQGANGNPTRQGGTTFVTGREAHGQTPYRTTERRSSTTRSSARRACECVRARKRSAQQTTARQSASLR